MASLIACAESGFEPIPGYVLRQKLGAGGYGEVWLADAPGGLKKAIKFVFGSLDDARASSELKALQRIRQVNHPFLLSLERIEILEGQLIIVTELADGSLCDQFGKCRENGLVGIPRDQVLDYLRDAADALDFLCQKHDLQHLDVKPANMLLVANRVKVADFGLVKDVQSHSMSMLGGMTPTYAAPEMFDGRPGRFSDQYSLAVVYQELLTGTLPFGGRTTAQLASEHLHRAPNLEPVPPMDRPILAKALAKKPNQRYGSCREFIDHLIKADRISMMVDPALATNSESAKRSGGDNFPRQAPRPLAKNFSEKDDSDRPKSSEVEHTTSTQSYEKREIETLANVELPKEHYPTPPPTLYIGLGGTGAEMLTELRSEMIREGIEPDERPEVGWLLIDTDSKGLDEAVDPQTCGFLSSQCTLHLPLKPSQYYREQEEYIFTPISRRWLYNVPRTRTTEGIRPLGMLAMLDHAETCYKVLTHYVQHLKQSLVSCNAPAIRIYLLSSVHGGTGSAILSEIAFLLRRAIDEANTTATIQAFLTVGESDEHCSSDLKGASAIACLSELAHYEQSGGLHPDLPSLTPSHAAPKPPVDHVYMIHGGRIGDHTAWQTAVHQAIEYVFADSWSPMGFALDSCREATIKSAEEAIDRDWAPWIRTLCSRRLDVSSQLNPMSVTQTASLEVAQRWMVRLKMNQLDLSRESMGESGSAQRKKSMEQIDFLISDLFRDHRWTAQAWVNRCIELLFQANRVPLEEDVYVANPCIDQLLKDGIEVEVERLSERLGIDLEQSRLDAVELMDSTLLQLGDWIELKWLPTKAGWSHLHTMLQMIGRRFREQGTSLCNVSFRLRQEHDRILEKLHGSQQATPDGNAQGVIDELDRLEIQARVHDIAGQMLERLGEHVVHLADKWRQEASSNYQILELTSHSLADQLDVKLGASGLLAESLMPLPAEWEPIRTQVSSEMDDTLASWMAKSRRECWGCDNTPANDAAPRASDWGNPTSDHEPSGDGPQLLTQTSNKLDTHHLMEMVAKVAKSSEKQCEGLGITWQRQSTESSERKKSSSILNQVRESTPTLLQWGGAKRNFLILPLGNEGDESDARWKSMFDHPINLIRSKHISDPMMFCEGERMILPEIICRMWTPESDKIDLANRVRSRADVDWQPLVF